MPAPAQPSFLRRLARAAATVGAVFAVLALYLHVVEGAATPIARQIDAPASLVEPVALYPMLERYGPTTFTQVDSYLFEEAAANPAHPAEFVTTRVAQILAWREANLETMARARFVQDWSSTPPMPALSAPATLSPERFVAAVDRGRHGALGGALITLARSLERQGDTETAARLTLVCLAAARQALVHEATGLQCITPSTHRMVSALVLAATLEQARLASRGTLPPALLDEALARLAEVDALFPLADHAALGHVALARDALKRHPSKLIDDERIISFLGLHWTLLDQFAGTLRRGQVVPEPSYELPVDHRHAVVDLFLNPLTGPTVYLLDELWLTEAAVLALADRDLRLLQQLRASALAWALAAIRAETGEYPPTLEAAARRIPERMRIEPASRRPFLYRRVDDGFQLWIPRTGGSWAATAPAAGDRLLVDSTVAKIPPERALPPYGL